MTFVKLTDHLLLLSLLILQRTNGRLQVVIVVVVMCDYTTGEGLVTNVLGLYGRVVVVRIVKVFNIEGGSLALCSDISDWGCSLLVNHLHGLPLVGHLSH